MRVHGWTGRLIYVRERVGGFGEYGQMGFAVVLPALRHISSSSFCAERSGREEGRQRGRRGCARVRLTH